MKFTVSSTAKILAGNLAFLFILIWLCALLIRAKDAPIRFAEKEKLGNEYQRPLEKLLLNISQHKILSLRIKAGDAAFLNSLKETEAKVDQWLLELSKTHKKIGEYLEFTDTGLSKRNRSHLTIENLSAEWSELKSNLSQLTVKEAEEKHTHIISDLRQMITHAGDTSNLILDPDLDSYYLMDVTLLALPQMQDRIQQIVVMTEQYLRGKSFSDEDRLKIAIASEMLQQADFDRIDADVKTTLSEDQNFFGTSASLQEDYKNSYVTYLNDVSRFIAMSKQIASSKTPTIGVNDYMKLGEKALNASYGLWDESVSELDKLLDARIQSFENDKKSALVGSAVAIICNALLIFVAFIMSRKQDYVLTSVREINKRLSEGAKILAETSQLLQDSSSSLSETSSKQASALQETAASIEEINATVKKNAENSIQSLRIASASQTAATRGKDSVEEMEKAMETINDSNANILHQIEDSNRQIGEIIKVILEIESKTKVINDIVFQTKLLSFNASVEAARAGEHGKGFAVVAEEVGNLAQMSGGASKEISEMLRQSIDKVESIIKETTSKVERLISEGQIKVSSGMAIARQCGEILDEVVKNVREVNSMVSEISIATDEQSKGITEIAKAMNQLDESTQDNASTAKQSAHASQKLSINATSLYDAVSELERVVVSGRKAG